MMDSDRVAEKKEKYRDVDGVTVDDEGRVRAEMVKNSKGAKVDEDE